MIVRYLALVLTAAACGGSGSATKTDGGMDATASSCNAACFEQRWWINIASNCAVACTANPGLSECGHADCKQISSQRYEGGMLGTLAPMIWSEEDRSFYLLGARMDDGYSLTSGCEIRIDMRPAQSFTCNGATLTFPVGTFSAAGAMQATALDAAAAAGSPGRYTYRRARRRGAQPGSSIVTVWRALPVSHAFRICIRWNAAAVCHRGKDCQLGVPIWPGKGSDGRPADSRNSRVLHATRGSSGGRRRRHGYWHSAPSL